MLSIQLSFILLFVSELLLLNLSLFVLIFFYVLTISDSEWMDALVLSRIKPAAVKGFEQLAELRAQRHEHLRWRNNVTTCRSPTREIDTNLIKDEMKNKRHQEFLKRRSVSLELCSPSHPAETFSPRLYSKLSRANTQNAPESKGRLVMMVPQSSTNHRQVTKIIRNPAP